MSDDGESSRSPGDGEESQESAAGWMVELIYYSVPGKHDRSKRGKAFRRPDGELSCFEAYDGTRYRPGDHVYIESGNNDPFIIGAISLFKMSKKEILSVKVSRFFRREEVHELSISLILQERNEVQESEEPIVDTHPREVFTSESAVFYPISSLRGKCEVNFVKDFRSFDHCDLQKTDAFFSCLSYNQESLRLAAVQSEIRIGGAYQAKLPLEATCSVGDEPDRDELIYRPGQITEHKEQKYIQLARSFRMFAMFDQKTPSVEKNARVSDLLFDDCIGTLHRCGYKFDEALKEMNANDKLLACDANFMTPEDAKKFLKGIKTFGKNFLKISRELLPLHSRDQLVAYYYLWKKTADATKPKPLGKPRNQVTAVKKKNGNNKASRPASTEYNDYASASESDVEEGKGQHYACHHCYTSDSRDWHHAGRDSMLLCTDCRLFFKKYGQLRPVDRPSTVPPTLYKRSPSHDEEDSGVKTRAGKNGRRRTPSMGDERRSPSQSQSVHEFDMEKTPKHKNGKRKKSHIHNNSAKKKKLDDDQKDQSPEKDLPEEESPQQAETVEMERNPSSSTPPEDPIQNGILEEKPDVSTPIEDEADELKPEPTVLLSVEPSTSKEAEEVPICKPSDFDDEEEDLVGCYDPNENDTWEDGKDEVAFETVNSIFIRKIKRKSGHGCSRTDFQYRIKPGGAWDAAKLKNKDKVEVKKEPGAAPLVQPVQPTVSVKKEVPLPLGLDPRLQAMDPQTMLMILQHQAQLQATAMAQQQAQQQAYAMQEHQQQMIKMEMQRHQHQQAQAAQIQMQMHRDVQRLGALPHMMDPRIAAAFGILPHQMGTPVQMDPRVVDMIAQQTVMQQMQHQISMQNPLGVSPEMQNLLLHPQLVNMFQQQHQLAVAMNGGITNTVHQQMPVGVGSSDMMRRLQQEGHRAFQP